MKSLIIVQRFVAPCINRGSCFEIWRIFVPEANNLAITVDGDGRLDVWKNFALNGNCRTIKEIDLPDYVVKQARCSNRSIKPDSTVVKYFQKIISEAKTEAKKP